MDKNKPCLFFQTLSLLHKIKILNHASAWHKSSLKTAVTFIMAMTKTNSNSMHLCVTQNFNPLSCQHMTNSLPVMKQKIINFLFNATEVKTQSMPIYTPITCAT